MLRLHLEDHEAQYIIEILKFFENNMCEKVQVVIDEDRLPDEIDDIHECIYSIISKISTEAILNTKLSLH
jgi:hypothetical protein